MSRCPNLSAMREMVEATLVDFPTCIRDRVYVENIDYVYMQFPCRLPADHDGECRFDEPPIAISFRGETP
jgi:hypothetical protein